MEPVAHFLLVREVLETMEVTQYFRQLHLLAAAAVVQPQTLQKLVDLVVVALRQVQTKLAQMELQIKVTRVATVTAAAADLVDLAITVSVLVLLCLTVVLAALVLQLQLQVLALPTHQVALLIT